MENRSQIVKSKSIKGVKIRVTPGHFATNHSHINYYVDLTDVKVRYKMAKNAAAGLASGYGSVVVDTIICLEGTEMVGAFMADELSQPGPMGMNSGMDISVLTPELNANNQLVFRENTQGMVRGKRILLLIASASTGKTVNRALQCLEYYGGQLAGICALFSVVSEIQGHVVNAIFTTEDIADYRTFLPGNCEMCGGKQKIDAIVNSYGYSKL